MEISVEVDSNIICLKLVGSLVASTLDAVKTQVQKLTEKKYVHIIFDMNGSILSTVPDWGCASAPPESLTPSQGGLSAAV